MTIMYKGDYLGKGMSGRGEKKEKGDGVNWLKYTICMCEHRIMKSLKDLIFCRDHCFIECFEQFDLT
jgi:hypothetical protein